MRYLPHTDAEIQAMLEVVGHSTTDDLFASIPRSVRLNRQLNLPPPLAEIELKNHLRELSRLNAHGEEWTSFLGGGAYAHYIPSSVGQLLLRGEFLTAYTPYQPEVSQGTLQAIFEYQTMVAEILGMEIANASHYDGSSATAEAVLMAQRLTGRGKVLVACTLHPEYQEVLRTYLRGRGGEIQEVPYLPDGTLDRSSVLAALDGETACLVAATPNFFGIIEDLTDLADPLQKAGALLVVASHEPLTFGVFKPPGEMRADIAVAEGSSLGNPISLGGPSLGFFATHQKLARSLPGRLVGETVDQNGRRGFVLTLATREQHIRREKATSNICTNVSLCALACTITLALLGKKGFEQLSRLNFSRAQHLKKRLSEIRGISLPFSGTTFNEFVVSLPGDPQEVLERLSEKKILGGIPLKRWYPGLKNHLLICLTEITSDLQVDRLIEALRHP